MPGKPPKRCPPGTVPRSNPSRCVPVRTTFTRAPGIGAFGNRLRGTPSSVLFPFSNSASGQQPGQTIAPPSPSPVPPPIVTGYRDVLTDPGFTVPFVTTTMVSGGGAALQAAVTAAGANERILIQDSLDYFPVVIGATTNLTIEAEEGQAPTITASPGSGNACIRLSGGAIDGLRIAGLTLIGTGNQNNASQTGQGLIFGRSDLGEVPSLDRLIIEDCDFIESLATAATGAPGFNFLGTDGTLHQRIVVRRCTFDTNYTSGSATITDLGACNILGCNLVYVQNCHFFRGPAKVTRAASHMKGFVTGSSNAFCEDCLFEDLGIAGLSIAVYGVTGAGGQFGTAVGTTTVRNCVMYNCRRAVRPVQANCTFLVRTCVAHTDQSGIWFVAGVHQGIFLRVAGAMDVRDSVVMGIPAMEGNAFGSAGPPTHSFNDLFQVNVPTGLDATEIQVDPLFQDVPQRLWVATEPAVVSGGSDGGAMGVRYTVAGEVIIWILAT